MAITILKSAEIDGFYLRVSNTRLYLSGKYFKLSNLSGLGGFCKKLKMSQNGIKALYAWLRTI